MHRWHLNVPLYVGHDHLEYEQWCPPWSSRQHTFPKLSSPAALLSLVRALSPSASQNRNVFQSGWETQLELYVASGRPAQTASPKWDVVMPSGQGHSQCIVVCAVTTLVVEGDTSPFSDGYTLILPHLLLKPLPTSRFVLKLQLLNTFQACPLSPASPPQDQKVCGGTGDLLSTAHGCLAGSKPLGWR